MIEINSTECRDQWIELLTNIARPVLSAAKGRGIVAEMPVETAPDSQRDRSQFCGLEAVGRLLCGIAPLLERELLDGTQGKIQLSDVHNLIAVSVDPDSPKKLNFSKGKQPLVDAAFLAQAIIRAPNALWKQLPDNTKSNLVRSMRQTRNIQPHYNNWILFSAIIEAMFLIVGEKWDKVRVDYALRQHESWYKGDGFYSDGENFRFDYYNSFVIQPVLRDLLESVATKNGSWNDMRTDLLPRMKRYACILERMIGTDGSFPPVGRSLSYRCAAFQPLAQLALFEDLPSQLRPAQVRCALNAAIMKTLKNSSNYDPEGWLKIGLNGSQPYLAESYISTGSLYLCSTAFLPLGLPKESPFWNDPEMNWSQKKIWHLDEDIEIDKSLDKDKF